MLHPVLFVGYHRREIHILNAPEYILFDSRINFLKLLYQLLDLHPLRVRMSLRINRRAGIGEVAGTLDEVQTI